MIDLTENKDIIPRLVQDIEADKTKEVTELLENIYAADIAEIFYEIDMPHAKYIMNVLEDEKVVNVLKSLDEDVLARFFKGYSHEEVARLFVEKMDSDDAVDMINSLTPKEAEQVISSLTDKAFARDILSLLHYDDDSAGGLMAKELIKVQVNWTVSQCIEEIRKQAENVEKVYTVYAVDDSDTLLGIVSLKKIILARATTRVEEIMRNDFIAINAYASGEEVASTMNKYSLVALPVIDALGRLMGRITFDDVMEFVIEEADKDYQMLSGISENVEPSDKVWLLSRARLPWLIIGLIGGIGSSLIIGSYDAQLQSFPQLIFFIPLVAAMGGNAGVQSSSIIVQGLANNSLKNKKISSKLGKEFMVSLINGLVCSALMLIWNIAVGQEYQISLTVSVSLISVIICASVLGTLTPLILEKFKIDPALATGPFITTTNDVLGLGIYFLIGKMLLDLGIFS